MAKYLFVNWETVPFKRKTYEEQLERFLKVCIVSEDNPQEVLLVLTLYGNKKGGGFSHLIEVVRNHELGQDEKSSFPYESLLKPEEGELVDVPSKHGPLYRIFTKDDAKYGLCSNEQIGKVERTSTGRVKVYHSIRVFSLLMVDNATGKKEIAEGWFPDDFYYRFFGYNYYPLSNLVEPLQI